MKSLDTELELIIYLLFWTILSVNKVSRKMVNGMITWTRPRTDLLPLPSAMVTSGMVSWLAMTHCGRAKSKFLAAIPSIEIESFNQTDFEMISN